MKINNCANTYIYTQTFNRGGILMSCRKVYLSNEVIHAGAEQGYSHKSCKNFPIARDRGLSSCDNF